MTVFASSGDLSAYRLHYQVAMRDPASHLFEINIQFDGVDPHQPLVLKFPVWTPGSYLVREYARHVQDWQAWGIREGTTRPLAWAKQDKHTWVVSPEGFDFIEVRYRLYAHELTVRTNHFDGTHGYLNGAATFVYGVGYERDPLALTVTVPDPRWQVATSLPRLDQDSGGRQVHFHVQHFDQLVDSPVEAGIQQRREFEVLGKPHQLVVWGEGVPDLDQVTRDMALIVPATAAFWDGILPYERYLFLVHLSPDGFGGLEHRDSTSLLFSRFGFQKPDSYRRFLALVAHEFFHTWNVKRLRPLALETYDYQQESYLTCLWFCEGATSYYENRILMRANLINAEQFLQMTSERIARLESTSGHKVQSLAESSFDTWIKLYRPHENTRNSQVSYYLKGALVCWLLDLHLRAQTQGSHSLDSVLKLLWERFGRPEKGYTDQDLQSICEEVAGRSLEAWFTAYIRGTDPLDYEGHLHPFGLTLKAEVTNPTPYLGIQCKEGSLIASVDQGSPAQRAGLWAGDELVALDGFKVTGATLTERLRGYQPGQWVTLMAFQQEHLRMFTLQLDPPRPDHYRMEPVEDPTPAQQDLLARWLGD